MLVATCAPAWDAAASDLLRAVAQRHATGPALRPGALVDAGWALLQVRADGAGSTDSWQLCEPVYGAEPLDWRPGLDTTLSVLDSQAALVRMLNVQPLRTRFDQALRVAPGAMGAPRVFLERQAVAGEHDSGWYVGLDEKGAVPERRNAVAVTAGRLVADKACWLAVLALPVGFMAFFEDDRLDMIIDAADQQVYPLPEAAHG